MRGKHAALSTERQIKNLRAATEKLKTDLTTERKERITLQRKLTNQSSMLKEITRLRHQVDNQISDKYLKLEKKYSKTHNTLGKLESHNKGFNEQVGELIGMYALERKITRSEAMDAWFSQLTGDKDTMMLFEVYGDRFKMVSKSATNPLKIVLEKIRRKKFEMLLRMDKMKINK